ncbi:hypothetical protein [Oleiharenicola lentus]|uniref:hypothetical protein n=1 Tax=Oleiharenicola lentus TaxID=2508720 RepID=UPI003F6775FA
MENNNRLAPVRLPRLLLVCLVGLGAFLTWKLFFSDEQQPRKLEKMLSRSQKVSAYTPDRQGTPSARSGRVLEVPDAEATQATSTIEYQPALRDKEYQRLLTDFYEERVAVEYAPLFRLLALPAEQQGKLQEMLVEKKLTRLIKDDSSDRGSYINMIIQADDEIRARMREVLSDEAYRSVRWFELIPPTAKASFSGISDQLAFSGLDLSKQQETELWRQLQQQHTKNPLPVSNFYESGILNDDLLEKIQGGLSKEQLNAIKAYTKSQKEIGRKKGA